MSFEKLMELGAESVGGFVYLDRVHLGNSSPVGFVLTPAGEELLNKTAAAPAKKAVPAKGKRAPKGSPENPLTEADAAADLAGDPRPGQDELDIDDILGGVTE